MTTRKIVPSRASPDRNDAIAAHEHGDDVAGTLRTRLLVSLVRHPGGRSFVAFDPGIIQNVRPGASWALVWSGEPEFTLKAV